MSIPLGLQRGREHEVGTAGLALQHDRGDVELAAVVVDPFQRAGAVVEAGGERVHSFGAVGVAEVEGSGNGDPFVTGCLHLLRPQRHGGKHHRRNDEHGRQVLSYQTPSEEVSPWKYAAAIFFCLCALAAVVAVIVGIFFGLVSAPAW